MKIAIVGSRGYPDWQQVENYINALPLDQDIVIVSGGARGVDTVAEAIAKHRGIPVIVYKPDYGKYDPKVAPIIRNYQIVGEADRVVAFWDGLSKGTKKSIDIALEMGKPIEIIYPIKGLT